MQASRTPFAIAPGERLALRSVAGRDHSGETLLVTYRGRNMVFASPEAFAAQLERARRFNRTEALALGVLMGFVLGLLAARVMG